MSNSLRLVLVFPIAIGTGIPYSLYRLGPAPVPGARYGCRPSPIGAPRGIPNMPPQSQSSTELERITARPVLQKPATPQAKNTSIEYAEYQFRTNQDFWVFYTIFYHNLVDVLDLNRFRAPEHIIENSISTIFDISTFRRKRVLNKA